MILIIPIAIVLFGVLAYKKWSPIMLAPFMALLICFVCGLPVLDTMLNIYMPSVASFVSSNFFIFFLGAMFGGVMELTGAAKSIAIWMSRATKGRFVLPLIMTITGILAYGGVAGFVVYFSVYPIALHLCREANISRALIPGAIYAGCWSWAMSMPGAPSVPNVLPMKSLGTTSMADAVPGFLFGGLMLYGMVFVYLEWQTRVYAKKGMQFIMDEHVAETMANSEREKLPNPLVSLIPLVVILVLFNLFGLAIEVSLLIGVLSGFLLLYRYDETSQKWLETFNQSAGNSAVIILNTAMVIGFAGVIKTTDSFGNLVSWLGTLSMHPLVYVAVTVAFCAAAAASASGGIGVALTTFQDTYLSMGVAPEEALALIRAGHDIGLTDMIATHVSFPMTSFSVELQKECISLGAVVEHCYYTPYSTPVSIESICEQIRSVGCGNVLLSTDMGQTTSPDPVEGLADFANLLMEKGGFSMSEVRHMLCDVPARLVE